MPKQLTPRQLETLANLKKSGFTTPQQVIAWCENRLTLSALKPIRGIGGKRKRLRRHSLQYYRDIIEFLKGGQQ